MKLYKLLPVLCLLAGAGPLESREMHPLGLIWKDPRSACPDHRAAIELRDRASLPRSVDHSANMPPTGDQGSQGSCTAWAVGYYYKTYQEWREHGWSTADPWRQYSPSFIYNQINGGVDQGSWFGEAFQLLCEQGCAPLILSPYNGADWTSWPREAAYDSALPYRCQEWHWFEVSDDGGIQAIKQLLDQGDNAVIGLSVYANYDNINNYDTTYCVADLSGENRGGHANCIVGYDDDKVTHDGPGAFRVVNSWGPSWGNGGYYWFSYQALKDWRTSYQAAFYSDDRTGYRPSLKLKARLAHPRRSTVEIAAGIGPADAPVWTKGFYSEYGGGIRPFPANCMVFDISEAAPFLAATGGNNLFLQCRDWDGDGHAGSIDSLAAVLTEWGVEAQSPETPVPITDDAADRVANLSLHCQNYGLAAAPAAQTLLPGGQAGYSVALSAINGFSHPVDLQCQITPLPAAGTLTAGFAPGSVVPTGSSLLTISASADAAPGLYRADLTAIDPLDTIVHRAAVDLWVLGSGQALCIGADAPLLALVRNVYPAADSVWSVPPVLGGNYQAVVVRSGASPADTQLLRTYLAGGGRLLLTSRTPKDLCAGTALGPIAEWLGADTYSYYWGSGMPMVCDQDQPFALPTIHHGDILGTAQYGYGRLINVHDGAVPVAHLGTATGSIAALANGHGQGDCCWYAGDAGIGPKSDSLLQGFLRNGINGVSAPAMPVTAATGGAARFTVRSNPTSGPIRCTLTLPAAGHVTARLYGLTGRLIGTLHHGKLPPGRHALDWTAADPLAPGCYFIRVETPAGSVTRKIVVIR